MRSSSRASPAWSATGSGAAKTTPWPTILQQAGFDIRHPRIARYLDLCMRMQNLPRHLGQHSGGMVICAGMLNRVVPLERASMPGRTVIQWDKEDCADMGLIKVDLLGLGMMAVLKDSIELIPRHYKKEIDLAALPEDPLVYRDTLQGRHRGHVPGGEPCADGVDSTQRAGAVSTTWWCRWPSSAPGPSWEK
jgi:DNA polymerase III alpha subunit